MDKKSLNRTGSLCCFGFALSMVVVAITFLLLPVRSVIFDPVAYFQAYVDNKALYRTFNWAFAVAALFGLGVVPAASNHVRALNEGLVRWMMNLAYLGFGVLALGNFRTLGFIDKRADVFLSLDAAGQKILSGTSLALDQHAYLTFGATGLWILAVSVLLVKEGSSKGLGYLGIALGVIFVLVVVGWSTPSMALLTGLASVGGIAVGPIWFTLLGIQLRKAS